MDVKRFALPLMLFGALALTGCPDNTPGKETVKNTWEDMLDARPSGIDHAPLSVLLDVRHPLSYLALPSALELARELGIEINWLPIVTPPLKTPSTPAPDDDRGIRHAQAAEALGVVRRLRSDPRQAGQQRSVEAGEASIAPHPAR